MRIAIVGGKLQGSEAAYLARKAGWKVYLVDNKTDVPARGLSDFFLQADVNCRGKWEDFLEQADVVLPCLEEETALTSLWQWSSTKDIPLVYDPRSYFLSSSKKRTDDFLDLLGIPRPRSWPNCALPVLAKPSSGSGSKAVKVLCSSEEISVCSAQDSESNPWIFQEFLKGASYSLEIIGDGSSFWTLQITKLEMDSQFDCKRVLAPADLPLALAKNLEDIALQIAQALKLKGIMDVEVILDQEEFKVLEIDARLPSQTPIAVYWSTGWNMLEILCGVLDKKERPVFEKKRESCVILEHLRVAPGSFEVAGEHIMAIEEPYQAIKNFYGADEAITNYAPNRKDWVATLICTGKDRQEANFKRDAAINAIKKEYSLPALQDEAPPEPESV